MCKQVGKEKKAPAGDREGKVVVKVTEIKKVIERPFFVRKCKHNGDL